MKKGNYSIKIENIYNVTNLGATKGFKLTTVNEYGGQNSMLGLAYILMGVICFVISSIFLVKEFLSSKRYGSKYGD